MKKILSLFIIGIMMFCLFGCAAADDSGGQKDGGIIYPGNPGFPASIRQEPSAHDPSVIAAEGAYYIFGTHNVVYKSDDLIKWTKTASGRYFETENRIIPEMYDAYAHNGNNTDPWAPDITKGADGKYWLYYCASKFGTTESYIGLAKSDGIEGPYIHSSMVVKSYKDAYGTPNAIDPNVIYDKDGDMYLSYGSFFGGIYLLKLDNNTGLPESGQHADSEVFRGINMGKKVAGGSFSPLEGPYIIYNPETDYYYMFVSYGSLDASDSGSGGYNIRTARAKNIYGPYTDANGRDMNNLTPANRDTIGTKLLGSFDMSPLEGESRDTTGVMLPGHNSVLCDGGQYYIVHHTRTLTEQSGFNYIGVRRMYFNSYGWPVVMPNRYTGETLQKITVSDIADRDYKIIEQGADSNGTKTGNYITGEKKPSIINFGQETVTIYNGEDTIFGTYELIGEYGITITFNGRVYNGVISPQWETDQRKAVIAISASSSDGYSILINRI